MWGDVRGWSVPRSSCHGARDGGGQTESMSVRACGFTLFGEVTSVGRRAAQGGRRGLWPIAEGDRPRSSSLRVRGAAGCLLTAQDWECPTCVHLCWFFGRDSGLRFCCTDVLRGQMSCVLWVLSGSGLVGQPDVSVEQDSE